jgi:four helix bundle protein
MIDKHLELRERTKKFSFRIIKLYKGLPRTADAEVIGKQLLRCATSVAANYRAIGRCRTKAEFENKLRIVLEEADESAYWLECIREASLFRPELLKPLEKEADELTRIFSASLRTVSG